MKKRFVPFLTVAVAALASAVSVPAAPATPAAPPSAPAEASGARIQFDSLTHDFGKVSGGSLLKHSFVFTNTGTTTLEIKEVRPGCGCTTAGGWDREIEPGKTGSIPIQFNTGNFSGNVAKSTIVVCNDPTQPNVTLNIKATVWNAIDVTPPMPMFMVSSEGQTNETRVVKIVNNTENPLALSELHSSNPAFRPHLKTVQPGKEFELHITVEPPFPSGTVVAPITLKTSLTNVPTLNVNAYLMVQEPVMVMPATLTLPPAHLVAAASPQVTIRNNGPNPLVLSDLTVNIPGAEARLNEAQPGRLFSVILTLPAGLEIKPGDNYELTVKSSHPKYPLLRVPITQQPRAPQVIPAPSAQVQSGAASTVRVAPATEAPASAAGGK